MASNLDPILGKLVMDPLCTVALDGCAERLPGHGRVEPCHRAVAGLGRDCAKRIHEA